MESEKSQTHRNSRLVVARVWGGWGNREHGLKAINFQFYIRGLSSGDVIYSMVTTVKNTVLKVAKRGDLEWSHKREMVVLLVIEMLANCYGHVGNHFVICASDQQIVHLKLKVVCQLYLSKAGQIFIKNF